MERFCDLLKSAREAAGFPSAYKFYHANGGRKHFIFTFVHYTRIEKGSSLPRPEWLERILLGLRVLPVAAEARALLTAYLKETLGGGRAAEYILGPLISGWQEAATDTLAWMKRYNSEHITPEAFSVMASSETHYWCAEALFNDTESWQPAALAEKLGLKCPAVKTALADLERCGLAAKTADGRYKCSKPGRIFSYPGRLEGMGAMLDMVQGYWKKNLKRDFFERLWIGRAKEGDMANYRNSLAQAVDSASTYASHSGGKTTGFFIVETRVRRLKDF